MIPTNDASFARDPDTHAVINTNTAAYLLYKQQRSGAKGVEELGREVSELKTELSEIKQLLGQLVQNVNINR